MEAVRRIIDARLV